MSGNFEQFAGGRPRRGRLEVEEVPASDYETEHGLVAGGDVRDKYTQRVLVLKVGPPPIVDGVEVAYDFEPGDVVLVPYHSGRRFEYFDRQGHIRELWIIHEQEVMYVFPQEPRVMRVEARRADEYPEHMQPGTRVPIPAGG